MEAKLNLGILGALVGCWATLTLAEPTAALDPASAATSRLASLEDRFARDRGNLALGEELADTYLELDRADLAVAVLSTAEPDVLDDPGVAHRLARAYERSGRLEDALGTAEAALRRCARSLGTARAATTTAPPVRSCSERTYASLDLHVAALGRMRAWGVTDPRTDERAQLAYALSVRAARIALAP